MTSFPPMQMLDKEALVYKYTASICSQKMSNDITIKIPYNWVISHEKFLLDFRAAKSANFVSQNQQNNFYQQILVPQYLHCQLVGTNWRSLTTLHCTIYNLISQISLFSVVKISKLKTCVESNQSCTITLKISESWSTKKELFYIKTLWVVNYATDDITR